MRAFDNMLGTMSLADRIDALERRIHGLMTIKDEMQWRNARAEATTLLIALRNQYASDRRQELAERAAGPPSDVNEQLRRMRELIDIIDSRLVALT